jgi:hypothetical protein
VDFPIQNGDFPVCYVAVYQWVNKPHWLGGLADYSQKQKIDKCLDDLTWKNLRWTQNFCRTEQVVGIICYRQSVLPVSFSWTDCLDHVFETWKLLQWPNLPAHTSHIQARLTSPNKQWDSKRTWSPSYVSETYVDRINHPDWHCWTSIVRKICLKQKKSDLTVQGTRTREYARMTCKLYLTANINRGSQNSDMSVDKRYLCWCWARDAKIIKS